MRYYLLATLERRPMRPLELKDQTGRVRIGTMQPNYGLSRLEVELDESTFLQHAKAIAQAGRISGAMVFVAAVREDGATETHPHNLPPSEVVVADDEKSPEHHASPSPTHSQSGKEDDDEEEDENEKTKGPMAPSTRHTDTKRKETK